jgi:hypothetical protein
VEQKTVKLNALFFSGLFCIAATTVSAEVLQPFVLVQRNCTPTDDVTIDQEQPAQSTITNCTWYHQRHNDDGILTFKDGKPINEDPDIQVSLHIARDVDYVRGKCIFIPFIPIINDNNKEIDKIADVAASKAGWFTGFSSPAALFSGEHKAFFHKGKYKITQGKDHTQIIELVIKNYRNNLDADQIHYHANVIFDLNMRRVDRWADPISFNELNQLNCVFSPTSTYSFEDK